MLFDLKHAIRSLVQAPRFSTVAGLTLALGIGATVAIFSMVNAVLLRPLPYAQPERLALLYTDFSTVLREGPRRFQFARAEYLDLKRETKSWQWLEGWSDTGANIATAHAPVRINASFVTGGFMSALGVTPLFGRGITNQDDVPGAPWVALISYGLWQNAFGGERAVLGRNIRLNGKQCIVVGVMPEDFHFSPQDAASTDVWAPLQISAATADYGAHNIELVGRLAAGITLQQAQGELDAFVERWGRVGSGHHFDPKEHTISSYSLVEEMTRTARPALKMMFGAVCCLLLIACVNVAILVLARMESQRREVAIRTALGAGALRLARQFVSEHLLLSIAGAVLGLILAHFVLRLIRAAAPAAIPSVAPHFIGIDGPVLAFAIGLSLLTALGFGLTSLAALLRRDPIDAMKSGNPAMTSTSGAQRLRNVLVVAQLTLALVLLVGSGLMLRAFWNLTRIDIGVEAQGVITMSVPLPDVYTDEDVRRFWAQLEGRLMQLPRVQNVTLASNLPPISQGPRYLATQIEGFTPVPDGPVPYVPTGGGLLPTIDFYRLVSPSYFDTLGIRLLAGRKFDQRDSAQGARAAIINQTFAQTFWPRGEAIGYRVRPDGGEDWYTVIGVVEDVRVNGVEKLPGTQLYLPHVQVPDDPVFHAYEKMMRSARIAIRAPSKQHRDAVADVRRVVGEIDASLPLSDVRTLDDMISSARAQPRFLTLTLALFGATALALSAIGLYGVVSYMVVQRAREFGIRIALGAQPNHVLYVTLRRILTPLFCAIVLGMAGSWAATRLLTRYLYQVSPTDPIIFAAVAAFLTAIAFVSSYIPARHATRCDPLEAIRTQ